MSAANVNEYMNKLSSVLNWGIREELCAANPAKGLRLPNIRAAKDRRRAFSGDQLRGLRA
jgi:site-specific recombinase XerC